MFKRRPRNKKNVTLRDVAKHAGVSPKTVSNVINDWPYVTDETREKVQKSIKELVYRPNAVATSLRTGRTKTIGVIIADITNPFYGQLVRGIEDILYGCGYSIFLCNTNEDLEKELGLLEMLVSRGVDGLLMFGSRASTELLSSIVDEHIPIVSENSLAERENMTVVKVDSVGGGQMATEHLIKMGHRKIGHLGGPSQRKATDFRLFGYQVALENAGIPFDPSLVFRSAPSIRGGYEAALKLLPEQKPTAIFCYNDLMAIGAIVACRRLDLKIPEDLSIVGFDDIAMASLIEPTLSTMRLKQHELGCLAGNLLLDRINDGDASIKTVTFPVELVVRDSSNPTPFSHKQINEMLEHLLKDDLVELDPHEPGEKEAGG